MLSSPREILCGEGFPVKLTWMWVRWKAIITLRIISGRTACVRGAPPEAGQGEGLDAAGAKNVPDLAVDLGAVAAGLIDQLRPFLAGVIQVGLRLQVGSLHDCLHRIAQVVRQGP